MMMMMMIDNSNKHTLSDGSNRSSGDDDVDRISSLPDDVLTLILSFLPIENAVRASILSTRWKYIWVSLPNLDFWDRMCLSRRRGWKNYAKRSKIDSFQKFVDRVLLLHNEYTIHKFRLQCVDTYGYAGIEGWIAILSRWHKLSELVLRCNGETIRTLKFPCCLTRFESLTVLEISKMKILLPASVCFPRLKLLKFETVKFSGDKTTQQVSFLFPLLEKLLMKLCLWKNIRTINVYAPSLEKLELFGYGVCFQTQVKFVAVNLLSIVLVGHPYSTYSFGNIPSLVSAHFDIGHRFDSQFHTESIMWFCNVKDLTLSDSVIKADFFTDGQDQLGTFPNLVSLKVTNIHDGFSRKDLIKLLCFMPNIESLGIQSDEVSVHGFDEDGWLHDTLPLSILSKLKFVKIGTFVGTEYQKCLAAYLLEKTLEKMTLCVDDSEVDYKKENEILEWILNLPRGSPGREPGSSAEEAQLFGIVQALVAAQKEGFFEVVLISDSLNAIQALNGVEGQLDWQISLGWTL